MVQVNAIGDACPIPVIKTLHALQDLNGAGTVQTLVDNEIAVQNLTRLAESKGCSITTEKRSDKEFCVTITTENSIGKAESDEQIACTVPAAQKKTVVVISADHMGEGDVLALEGSLGQLLLETAPQHGIQHLVLPRCQLLAHGPEEGRAECLPEAAVVLREQTEILPVGQPCRCVLRQRDSPHARHLLHCGRGSAPSGIRSGGFR